MRFENAKHARLLPQPSALPESFLVIRIRGFEGNPVKCRFPIGPLMGDFHAALEAGVRGGRLPDPPPPGTAPVY